MIDREAYNKWCDEQETKRRRKEWARYIFFVVIVTIVAMIAGIIVGRYF